MRVGLSPSEGTGLVEVLTNPDKNGVFKITDKDTQKFVIEARDGATIIRKEYSLSGLELTVPAVNVSAVWGSESVTDKTCYKQMNTTETISQDISIFEDNSKLATGTYSGSIVGEITANSGSDSESYLNIGLKQDAIDYLNSLAPAGAKISSYSLNAISKDTDNKSLGNQSFVIFSTQTNQFKNLALKIYRGTAKVEVQLSGNYSDQSSSDKITITYDVSGLILLA